MEERLDPARYETALWRRPTVDPTDTVIFDEHGRSLDNVCYRSHWFVVVSSPYGGYSLLVKHGGGEERISLGYQYRISGITALTKLTSDERYLTFYTLLDVHHHAADQARSETSHRYAIAFLDKRLKRRKRNHAVYVEIQPKIVPAIV